MTPHAIAGDEWGTREGRHERQMDETQGGNERRHEEAMDETKGRNAKGRRRARGQWMKQKGGMEEGTRGQ